MTPPTIASLTAKFIAKTGHTNPFNDSADVMPHEVVTGFRADAATTWADAKAAFTLLGVPAVDLPMPVEWAAFVSQLHESSVMPLCLATVPQQMRDLSSGTPKANMGRTFASKEQFPGLMKWVESKRKSDRHVDQFMAAAILRSMGEFHSASAILDQCEASIPETYKNVLANERAALAWYQGDNEKAESMWNAMSESSVVLFNRGISEWLNNHTAAASQLFDRSAASIPDQSGWSHLAAFYASRCDEE